MQAPCDGRENQPSCRTYQGILSSVFPKHCGERIVSDVPDPTTLVDEQKVIVNCVQRYSALVFLLGLPLAGKAFSKSQETPKPEAPSAEKPSKISRKKVVVQPDDPQREAFEHELSLAYPAVAPEPTGRRVFELRAAPTQIRQFDDKLIDVWAYNGQVPAPVLRVKLGEEVEVLLRNELPQPTTIHWHGMRVPNAMDGVPGVTQDPVAPGETFTYKFTPKDAGTFWFHPHVRTAEQVERGLYGVLIVEDKEELPYDRDEVWVLDDWRLGRDGQIDPNFVTPHDLSHDGRWGQVITVNGKIRREMVVRPGERIRLRLANTSNGRVFRPTFSRLKPRIIAVDGMYTGRPLEMNGFELAPGNRLDLDLVIPLELAGKTIFIIDRFTRNPYALATIKIEGEPMETPQFEPPSNPNIPKYEGALARDVDVTYVLNGQAGGKYGVQWTINGHIWGEHEITEFTGDVWTRLRFQNISPRLHPMHIHGQFFKVIARDGKAVDEPYFRDTVLLFGKQTIDVAMVPIDWGKWMMHCHILEHAEAGMMTEIEVGD